MADYLLRELKAFGCEVREDDAAARVPNGAHGPLYGTMPRIDEDEAGNVIASIKGTVSGAPALLFVAHMDTVLPTKGLQPQVAGGVISSDGKTILGADDRAGITAILEAIRYLRANNIAHGDLQFLFTMAEETGLFGSMLVHKEELNAQYAFVLDSGGPPDVIITSAPTEVDITATIYGKAAHSGVNPEDGLNAIAVAADAIAQIKMGRIDEETTVNIGVIRGGERVNIVCDRVEVKGEVRSRDRAKLSRELAKIHSAFHMAGEKWGAQVDLTEQKIYEGFSLNETDEVVRLAREGLRRVGINATVAPRGGGSDTNNLNQKGIPAVNLGVGANQDHTVNENIRIRDLVNATRLVIGIIQTAAERAGVNA